jgi:hypothetical protein
LRAGLLSLSVSLVFQADLSPASEVLVIIDLQAKDCSSL